MSMNKIQKKSIQLQHNSVCCRVCLMRDCRLYNIYEYELAETFTRISGIPMSRDRLPQYLCAFCYVLLLKCSAFQDMCLHTQQLFGELNSDRTRKNQLPQRSFHLTQSHVEFVEVNPSEGYVKYESDEEILVETIDHNEDEMKTDMEETETEVDNNILNLNDLKDESKTKSETRDKDILIERLHEDETEIEYLEDEISDEHFYVPKDTGSKRKAKSPKDNIVTNIENISVDKNLVKMEKKNKDDMKMLMIEMKNGKLEFKVADGSDDEDHLSYKEVKKVDKNIGNKQDTYDAEINAPPKNEFDFDIGTFQRKYNVIILVLSKEEQLEEIANRKKSRNYLESRFQCEECGKGFDMEAAYNNHRAKHSPLAGPHQCEICRVRFKGRNRVKDHGNRHRFKFFCNECDIVSRTRSEAKTHHAVHAGLTFSCQHCDKRFSKRSTCFGHMRLAHPSLNVVCDECGETFVSEKGLRMHKKWTHGVKLQCTTCSAIFNTMEALNRHTETAGEHADLRPCEQCGENCASEIELQKHVEETHAPRRCEECDMTFSNSTAFDTHVSRKHVGKRYVGPFQGRKLYGLKSYNRYNAPRMCDQCGITVRGPTNLMYHMRKHGVCAFACANCPKKFVTKKLLTEHMRTHTGERPFKCPDCPQAFSLKGNLQRHRLTAHLGVRKSFECQVCGRTFTTKASMQMHHRAVHAGAGWPKRDRSKRKKAQETTQSDNECNSNSNIVIDRPKRNCNKRKKTQAETIQSDSESNLNIQSDSESNQNIQSNSE